MKQKILLVGVVIATSLAAFNAIAQVKTQRMIVMLNDDQVARQVVRSGERIDSVFVDQRYQKNPKLWSAVSLPAALLVRDLENQHGARAEVAFGAYTNGFAAELNEQQILSLKADPRVKSVFPDATGALASGPPPWTNAPSVSYASTWTRGWNISSISADTASSSYRTDGGYPVKAFILDSGVQPHYDLNYDPGTSSWSFDTHGNPDPYGNACSAHATHVAGIIGAYRSPAQTGVEGVAPGAVIWSMRIVNYCQVDNKLSGLVYLSSVLTAINAIEGQTGIAKEPNAPLQRLRAVANMSVLWDAKGGELFIDLAGRDALRATMKTAVENGVFFSVAGGNSYQNAKYFYPAAVGCALYEWDDPSHTLRPALGGVMGVGAIQWTGAPMNRDAYDPGKIASYGGCVKIWAPGQSVHSTVAQVTPINTYPAPPSSTPAPYPLFKEMDFWNPWGGTSAAPHNNLGQNYFDEMSGSSMAAPHIAGAALLFAKKRQSLGQPLPYPWEVENFLLSRSTAIGPNYGPPGESAPVNLINVSGW